MPLGWPASTTFRLRLNIGSSRLTEVIKRYLISFCLAAVVTFGLFFLMQYLIAESHAAIEDIKKIRVVDFVRLKHESVVKPKKRERPQRPQASQQPSAPDTKMPQPSHMESKIPAMQIAAPTPDVDLKVRAGPTLGPAPTSDADEIPLVRVEPQYPRIAAQDRIEGWVRIRFDVNPSGRVINPVVVAAKPMNVFNQAALQAVKRWRYRPKVRNGVAVERKGIVVKLTFKLRE